jgi:plastocyanin
VTQWLVFVHIIGVLAFLGTHGVSMGVLFKLRTERDVRAVNNLLALSTDSIRWFYVAFALLLGGGIASAFTLHVWGQRWLWLSIAILVLVTLAMYGIASPYYKRVRLIARAMGEGSQAVTPEQFDQVLRSGQPTAIAGIGVVALLAILYLMVFQPTLGAASAVTPVGSTSGPSLTVVAQNVAFSTSALQAPAGRVTVTLQNHDGFPHDFTIDALGVKVVTSGNQTSSGTFQATPGTYQFYCSVPGHKAAGMVGTLTITPGGSSP